MNSNLLVIRKIKLTVILLIIGLSALQFVACTDDAIDDFEALPDIDLLGFWTSENANIATILQDSIQRINLEFLEDTSYLMSVTNLAGDGETYEGRFFFDEQDASQNIFPITLQQTSPDTVFYSGIYEINKNLTPNELTIEWVNTSVPNSPSTPNIIDGFGSTANGDLGIQNIQKYIKF